MDTNRGNQLRKPTRDTLNPGLLHNASLSTAEDAPIQDTWHVLTVDVHSHEYLSIMEKSWRRIPRSPRRDAPTPAWRQASFMQLRKCTELSPYESFSHKMVSACLKNSFLNRQEAKDRRARAPGESLTYQCLESLRVQHISVMRDTHLGCVG